MKWMLVKCPDPMLAQHGLWSSAGPRLGMLQTRPRKRHGIPSSFMVIEPNYSLNIKLWNATRLLHRVIQIQPKFKEYLRLFISRTWHTRSGRPKREFYTDTFRLTIRESHARDVYAIVDDVTTPYEPLYLIVSVIAGFRNISIALAPTSNKPLPEPMLTRIYASQGGDIPMVSLCRCLWNVWGHLLYFHVTNSLFICNSPPTASNVYIVFLAILTNPNLPTKALSVKQWTCKLLHLTHWGPDKLDAISQTTSSSAFSWMKMFELRLQFHWSLFRRVQLTIFQHWSR